MCFWTHSNLWVFPGETCDSIRRFSLGESCQLSRSVSCLIIKANSLVTHFQINCAYNLCVTSAASSSGMGVQESTAQQMVSDPTLVHVLVRFLSGGNPHGTSQHSSQVLSLMNMHT